MANTSHCINFMMQELSKTRVQSFASHWSSVFKKLASGGALPGLPEALSKLKRLLMNTILAPAF